ncbi:Phosphoprotein phosphatase [Bertholletia excelsa]
MGLKDRHFKLKAVRVKKFLAGAVGKGKREPEFGKKPSWMVTVTHGYHVVHDQLYRDESIGVWDSDLDSVVVERKQIEELELWFFEVFDARTGSGVSKYMQSHMFDTKSKRLKRTSKETMRKAYRGARNKMREEKEDASKVGSASALVINGEKLVTASIGDYRAVVCRDGEAHQIGARHQQGVKKHWSRRLIPACYSGGGLGNSSSKNSEIVVGDERIDSDTEFVILASTGIWEVMKHQEAVNLISHLEDPQEAAECLAKEALTRMSKTQISCLVIRFDQYS